MKKTRDQAVATTKSFFYWDGETLVLNILGKPSARQDAIGKPKGPQLKISVTAAPRAGRATDHMVRFLAEEFDVATGDIEVVFGRMNVNKTAHPIPQAASSGLCAAGIDLIAVLTG